MVNSESASNFDGRGQSYFIHGNLALNSTNSCQISLLLIWTNEHKFFFFNEHKFKIFFRCVFFGEEMLENTKERLEDRREKNVELF